MKIIVFVHRELESIQNNVCEMISQHQIATTWNGCFVYSENFTKGLHKISMFCEEKNLPMFAKDDQYVWMYNNPKDVGIQFDDQYIYIKQSGTHENIIRLRT